MPLDYAIFFFSRRHYLFHYAFAIRHIFFDAAAASFF